MLAVLERSANYDPSASGSSKGPVGRIPEKLLARLWQKRAARQEEFRTSGGRRVRVLYPGRPGAAAGPDFRDALLEVEGLGLVQGDVELHVRQQDWYAHGHADDPNYNGVVLHAALETSPQVTSLQSGHQAPVISLAALLAAEDALTPALSQQEREEGPGEKVWAILEARGWPRPATVAGLGDLLDAAGDARFQAKSRILHAFMREQSASQTLYEGIMEALGYRANRQPFLKLAHRAPWTALAREALAGPESESECSGIIERRLLELSGLSQSKERAGRRRMGYGLPLAAAEWHCFRVRPANHPRHRIAGAARLLARFLYFESLETELEEGQLIRELGQVVARGSAAKLTSSLTVAADPGQPTAGLAYVGAARAKDLAVNVVLPFFHALAEAENTGSSPALKLYRGFGKLQDNELTREMAALLLEPGTEPGGAKIVTTARRQQGLIHLHRQLAGG
jgi:hypothetical protein